MTARCGPDGMDRPRKPRTIGDLHDDAPFDALLTDPRVLVMYRRGRVAIRKARAEREREEEPKP